MPSGPDRVTLKRLVELAILVLHKRGARIISARDLVSEVWAHHDSMATRSDILRALKRLEKDGRVSLKNINDLDYLKEDR